MQTLFNIIRFALFRLVAQLLRRRFETIAANPRYAYARTTSRHPQRIIDSESRRLPDEPNRW